MSLGADLVVETVRQLGSGSVSPLSQEQFMQPGVSLKKAPKIYREDGCIDWNLPGTRIHNLIRGLSPYPGAYTHLTRQDGNRIQCKVFSSAFEKEDHQETPGTLVSDGRKLLRVAVTDGFIRIDSIQQEGKRQMDITDFLAGFSLSSCQPRFS
jgi:methionyl-tRNA formyltransferase